MPTEPSTLRASPNGTSHSLRQDGNPPQQQYMHPQDHSGGLQPEELQKDPSVLEPPSLLSRIHVPLRERITAAEGSAVNSKNAADILDSSGDTEDGEIGMGEGENSLAAFENEQLQEAPSSSSGVLVKAEEPMPVLPRSSPTRTRSWGRRGRGSRSTIDVFGDPLNMEEETQISPSAQPETTLYDPIPNRTSFESPPTGGSRTILAPQPTTVVTTGLSEHQGMLVSSPPSLSPSRSAASSSASSSAHSAPILESPLPPSASASAKPSPFPASVLRQCRDLLIPLINNNARVRKPDVDEDRVKERAQALLTDEQCAEFIRLALEARKQSHTGPKRSRTGSEDPSEPPTKVVRRDSPDDAPAVGDESLLDDATQSASEAEVDDLVALEADNRTPGIPEETISVDTQELLETQGADLAETVRPHTVPPLHPSSSQDADGLGDTVIISADDAAHNVEDTPLPGLDLPPALTEGSRTPSAHALDEASLPLSTTIARSGDHERPTLPIAPLDNSKDAADADAEISLNPTASPDTSRYETVTLAPLVKNEDEGVARASDDDQEMNVAQDIPHEEDHPPSVVPGVWAAVVGRSAACVDTNEFFVDDATADAAERWARRQDSFSVKDRHVAVHLLCLPQASVASAFQSLPQDANPGDIATALWNVQPSWPLQGRLVIQVNFVPQRSDNSKSGRVWLPADLTSSAGHIDITPWIVRGKNTLNLIELAPLSDYIFVVHATEPSAKEKDVVYADVLAWSHVSRFTSRSPARSPRNSQTPMAISAPSPLMI